MNNRIKQWLGDHFKWYRRYVGGQWAHWNGFWEQPSDSGQLTFRRGVRVDLVEGPTSKWFCSTWWDKIDPMYREEYK